MSRVLFFFEPVIFRGDPAPSSHFVWIDYFRSAVAKAGGVLGLISNPSVCEKWRNGFGERSGAIEYFEVNPYLVIRDHEYNQSIYAKELYNPEGRSLYLQARMEEIRERFRPDLFVISAQNGIASRSMAGVPTFYIEQAPLPRIGHPFRTGVDPSGHQVGSLFETQATRVRSIPLSSGQHAEGRKLLASIEAHAADAIPRGGEAREALKALAGGERIALFVTQPTDSVTFEGAYRQQPIENLLFDWAQDLPEGWIGVPTYHAGQQLNEALERSLAQQCGKLRFLPTELATGRTEALALDADGLVTISSTAAMTGLLFGKRVVVMGRGPLDSWRRSDIAKIEEVSPLGEAEIVSTLCFLTNRYSYAHDEVYEDNGGNLSSLIERASDQAKFVEAYFDAGDFEFSSAERLFSFRFNGRRAGKQYYMDLAQRLEGDLGRMREQLEALRAEWSASVRQREQAAEQARQAERERDDLRATAAQLAEEKARLEQNLAELLTAHVQAGRDLAEARAESDRLGAELRAAHVQAGRDLAESRSDHDRLRTELEELSGDHERLREAFSHLMSETVQLRELLVAEEGAHEDARAALQEARERAAQFSLMVDQSNEALNHYRERVAALNNTLRGSIRGRLYCRLGPKGVLREIPLI